MIDHHSEIDGNHYEILNPAAEALSARYPLAATLALRAMINFTLNAGKSSRYQHAARHLAECDALASQIEDFGMFELHDVYIARMKAEHGKKTGFWAPCVREVVKITPRKDSICCMGARLSSLRQATSPRVEIE